MNYILVTQLSGNIMLLLYAFRRQTSQRPLNANQELSNIFHIKLKNARIETFSARAFILDKKRPDSGIREKGVLGRSAIYRTFYETLSNLEPSFERRKNPL